MGIQVAPSISEAQGRLEGEIIRLDFEDTRVGWEFYGRIKLHVSTATQPLWETSLVGTAPFEWPDLFPGERRTAAVVAMASLAMTDAISKLGQAAGFLDALAQLSGVRPEVAKAPPTPPPGTPPIAPVRPEGREARVPPALAVPEWKSSGSGFLLRGTSHILTSLHVVEGAKEIRVSFPSGETYTGRVVAKDANNDLAVVQLQGMATRNEGFTIDPGGRVEVGEEVHALGYPLGVALSSQPSLVSGQVSAATGPRDNIAQFRMTAPINEGNSGGPLLNAKGLLVGIASAGLIRQGVEAIRFGTKVSAAALILNQAALARPFDIRVVPRRESYTPQELFREFSAFVVLVETK